MHETILKENEEIIKASSVRHGKLENIRILF